MLRMCVSSLEFVTSSAPVHFYLSTCRVVFISRINFAPSNGLHQIVSCSSLRMHPIIWWPESSSSHHDTYLWSIFDLEVRSSSGFPEQSFLPNVVTSDDQTLCTKPAWLGSLFLGSLFVLMCVLSFKHRSEFLSLLGIHFLSFVCAFVLFWAIDASKRCRCCSLSLLQ